MSKAWKCHECNQLHSSAEEAEVMHIHLRRMLQERHERQAQERAVADSACLRAVLDGYGDPVIVGALRAMSMNIESLRTEWPMRQGRRHRRSGTE